MHACVFMSELPFPGSCSGWVVDTFSGASQSTVTAFLVYKEQLHFLERCAQLRCAPLLAEEKQSFPLICQCMDTVTSVVPLEPACQRQEHEGAALIVLSSYTHPAWGRLAVCFLVMCSSKVLEKDGKFDQTLSLQQKAGWVPLLLVACIFLLLLLMQKAADDILWSSYYFYSDLSLE